MSLCPIIYSPLNALWSWCKKPQINAESQHFKPIVTASFQIQCAEVKSQCAHTLTELCATAVQVWHKLMMSPQTVHTGVLYWIPGVVKMSVNYVTCCQDGWNPVSWTPCCPESGRWCQHPGAEIQGKEEGEGRWEKKTQAVRACEKMRAI